MSFIIWMGILAIIMILIPIQWDEPSRFDYGIIFAYFTQIAWMIAIVILIVEAIKWIQKTKIGDYWKISFTILGVIGIIAYVFYALLGMGIFDNFSNEYNERIGDLDNQEMIRIHIEMLEEDGYEVLYFGYLSENTTLETAYLKMKSLGNRNDQVWDGLFSLESVYPNAPEYSIRILEPTQECWYEIYGELYGAYLGSEELILNDEVVDSLTAFSLINYIIDEQGSCS